MGQNSEELKQKIVEAAVAWYDDIEKFTIETPDLPHCEALTADNLFRAVREYKKGVIIECNLKRSQSATSS